MQPTVNVFDALALAVRRGQNIGGSRKGGRLMALTFSPGQLTDRAEFYHQLYQFTHAGIGLVSALEQLAQNPPARSYRAPIERALAELRQGFTFTEAWQRTGKWLPEFDMTLIEAGERSGRLDQCFRLLADHYSERAQLTKQMVATLLYPAFLVHFLVAVMTLIFYLRFPLWIAAIPLIVLGCLYVLVIFLIFAGQNQHAESWRAFMESLIHPIPVLGTARRYLALARLSAALEALLSAGVTVIEAWESAAAASGSPFLRRAVLRWSPQLHSGRTPAEIMSHSREFPNLFTSQYLSGEVSGRLDETLRHLRDYYQGEGSRKLRAVTTWVPILIGLFVMIVIGVFVIWFYVSRFNQILHDTNF